MTKTAKRNLWTFKASDELLERLRRASAITDRPASQIAREAISEKLNELAIKFPQINETPQTALEPVEQQAAEPRNRNARTGPEQERYETQIRNMQRR